ncbi:MAG TPA: hypothetical protein V6C81_16510 [Planktothrix sp.]
MENPDARFDAKAIDLHYQDFLETLTATGSGDNSVAEAAVERMYESAGLERPAIIWCRSFYQLLTMPSLLIGLLHSDIWELIAGDLTSRAAKKSWNRYWNRIWPDIWVNGGQPLLKGMNTTSALPRSYSAIEPEMISQARNQFGKALHSGRLDNMQHKLNREMYRRFWAPHTKEIAKDVWVRLKNDIYTQLEYLNSHNADWFGWDLIGERDRDADDFGEGIAQLFDFLADRLGGEPRAQAGVILDLPAGLPWLGTATLLRKIWPDQFKHCDDDINMWLDLAENCSALMSLEGVAFLCEKPFSFHLNADRIAHYDTGPFLAYCDGFAEYAWHGVLVPKIFIEDFDSITWQRIEETDNIEVRRVMLERFGMSRYIEEAGVEPVHEDQFGTLFRREMPNDEPLVLLKVLNSTPEPDGSIKEYFLRVPPNIQTAREAVAWTFGFDPETYDPLVQT